MLTHELRGSQISNKCFAAFLAVLALITLTVMGAREAGAQDNPNPYHTLDRQGFRDACYRNIMSASVFHHNGGQKVYSLRDIQGDLEAGSTVTWRLVAPHDGIISFGTETDYVNLLESGCLPGTLVLYGHPTNPHIPADPNSIVIASGELNAQTAMSGLHMVLPGLGDFCGYQLDAVTGTEILTFQDGRTYSGLGRLISAANWNDEDPNCDSTTTTTAPTTTTTEPTTTTSTPETTTTSSTPDSTTTTSGVTTSTTSPTSSTSTPSTLGDPTTTVHDPSTTQVNVSQPGGSTGESSLPRTGGNTGNLVTLGLCLAVLGGLILYRFRKNVPNFLKV